MRPIWSGTISFGLINIPVKLYSAIDEKGPDFDLLHKKDLSPIRYARICRSDGKEIPWEEIVKGYEYEEGDYVVLADEDFKKADLKKTKSIEVSEFVGEESIDSSYFEKPYYLEPDKSAAKAYALLREALKKSGKVGVAKFVLRARERLGIIKPHEEMLVLNQMRFANELRSEKELDLPKANLISQKDIDLALLFINQLTTSFDPGKYKDEYRHELEEVIEEKIKGKKPKARGKAPEPSDVKDLMSLLKKSLEREKERVPAQA